MPPADGPAPPRTLRVATFNIRNGLAWDGCNSWPFRRRATLRAIQDLDADVLGLQEVYRFQLRWLARHLPGYVVLAGEGRSSRRGGEMGPLLVRAGSATATGATTRWYGPTPDVAGTRLPEASFPRTATVAELHLIAWDRTVQVATTHLDEARKENRVRSAEQLLGWLRPDLPRLVVGDLNATPPSGTIAALRAGGLEPVLLPEGTGTAHQFTGRRDGVQIDHILSSGEWSVRSATVHATPPGPRLPSDHWPLSADLTLS
ncbi:MAG TPA: endonuclease/exonuclease/phosphatase family protein [Acidimicrobiales bacterium]|nr:endonuclease/exonuclease/phosphatase family protein [Acidimicrobiales bacterium]